MFILVAGFCAEHGIMCKKKMTIEDDDLVKINASDITTVTENQAEKNKDE